MAKQEKSGQSLNQIKTSTNIVFNIVFLILAVMCVIPLLFVFSISITDEEAIRQNGYQLIPQALSNAAYEFLWNERLTILRAAFMSVLVTIVGTIISIALNTSMGYVVSRRNFKLKKIYTWLIFIPMVFNGGMLASYVVVSNILGLNNSIWALILPLACSAFSVTIYIIGDIARYIYASIRPRIIPTGNLEIMVQQAKENGNLTGSVVAFANDEQKDMEGMDAGGFMSDDAENYFEEGYAEDALYNNAGETAAEEDYSDSPFEET